jgi:hypothetical protein
MWIRWIESSNKKTKLQQAMYVWTVGNTEHRCTQVENPGGRVGDVEKFGQGGSTFFNAFLDVSDHVHDF